MAKKAAVKKQESTGETCSVDEAVGAVRQVRDLLGTDLSIVQLTAALKKLHDLAGVRLADSHDEERNDQRVACLKKSLQAAVTLEFATIPPYLSALWSIKNELDPAAKSIRAVAQEEMLHMALACNMLASLGETPQISAAVPQYPGALPGGVHEGLIVDLVGLTQASLSNFLWIERPITEVPIENPYQDDKARNRSQFKPGEVAHEYQADETIGAFYEQIRKAFEVYVADPRNPPLTTDKQVSGPLAWTVIRNMDSVNFAIKLIEAQGEGSENNPEVGNGDLSHYYRFLELFNERRYRWNPVKKVLEDVGEMPWPEVWPMASVPAGGYQKQDVSAEVWHYLETFDNTYSKLVDLLQSAWTVGGQASLVHAYDVMFDLEWSAKPLMQTRLPFGGGVTYGPCWRYKPPCDRD